MKQIPQKLLSWLEANKIKTSRGLIPLFICSYLARAVILLYYSVFSQSKFVRFVTRSWLRSTYHIECSCHKIGDALMLPHPRNIIISAESIGNFVQINQNTTIGGNMKKTKQREWGLQKLPIIGNHVVIYTNAVVGGPVLISDHVILGANCVCTHDVQPHTMIYCKQYQSIKKVVVDNGSYQTF